MKHGFITEMESILDNGQKISHDTVANNIEAILMDPSKIGVKVSADVTDSCFNPIIESGGKYDLKASAVSNGDNLSADVIICSLGARYKGYCANLARTYMVDTPPKVEKTYAVLLGLHNACLELMIVGNELKDVYEGAKKFVEKKDAALLPFLTKTLGFSIGLEFRDGTLVLNDKNSTKFEEGMVFTLAVGFHNVPLSAEDKSKATGASKSLGLFSLLVADTVQIQKGGAADVLTKISKEFSDVSYNISDKDEDEEEDGEDGDKMDVEEGGLRRSKRSAEEREAMQSAGAARAQKQAELMKKKLEEKRKLIEKGEGGQGEEEEEEFQVSELKVYKSSEEYPRDVTSTQLRVDLEKEVILVPLNGQPVPFHISTIKSIQMPEPDRATYLRINFFCPGAALGKDVSKNMAGLITNHSEQLTFIKDLTFRSLNQRHLGQVFQHFSELRKRVRQREQKAEQEKDLVVQGKLIRIKDQRVPRLQDLTMRPQISGRKCIGTLEAHQNGLRFTSTKFETLDVLYANIKHAIYQPCESTTAMVVIHFHLKDFIIIGKKKQKDVQFYTEVVDSSLSLEGSKRSSYDPDELDEEQREREMRKRLNLAFKDFCQKLEKVAAYYEFQLKMDTPFAKSGFEANVNKEMVRVMPTTYALVNLTENPPFLVTISDIEHVHFERAGFTTKQFDIAIIFKNWERAPRVITAIDVKYRDVVEDWLNLVEITYTVGSHPMNWTEVMVHVREDDRFYYDTYHDGSSKPAGWQFLDAEYKSGGEEEDEEEESNDDSSYGAENSSEESSEESSDDDDDSDFDDEVSFSIFAPTKKKKRATHTQTHKTETALHKNRTMMMKTTGKATMTRARKAKTGTSLSETLLLPIRQSELMKTKTLHRGKRPSVEGQ